MEPNNPNKEVYNINQENTLKAEMAQAFELPSVDILDEKQFADQPGCSRICSIMFSLVGLLKNRKKIYYQNLYLQNEKTIRYQSTINYQFEVNSIRTLNQIQEVAEFRTVPQFRVGENMYFIDQITMKECNKVLSSSLPSNMPYYIKNYNSSRPLLCLDLDETLIASFQESQMVQEDFNIRIHMNGQEFNFSVVKRPFLDEFLLEMVDVYDLAIFTYSVKAYCDAILKIIDTYNLIKYRFYREHCVRQKTDEQHFTIVKDLTRVGVPLDKILLIDNQKKAGDWQPNNFILIKDFYQDKSDTILKDIIPILKKIGREKSIYKYFELHGQALENVAMGLGDNQQDTILTPNQDKQSDK